MRRIVPVLAATALLVVLTAPSAAAAATFEVELTDAGCPKRLEARAGETEFEVTNVDATAVSEFEILKGHRVLGERENLAPGLSASFTVDLEPGTYVTYCPGGDRERGKLVVTGGSASKHASGTDVEKIGVRLREFSVKPKPSIATAPAVKFAVRNQGTLTHEFVVVRTDGAPLPVAADGTVDEAALSDDDFVGELEDLGPKDEASLPADLAPGRYVLFCNLVEENDDGTTLSHYAEGMWVDFTVR